MLEPELDERVDQVFRVSQPRETHLMRVMGKEQVICREAFEAGEGGEEKVSRLTSAVFHWSAVESDLLAG